MNADAGEGFSDQSPRLHYGWKTTEEYRRRFGCLDYMWRVDATAPFEHDFPGLPALSAEILQQFTIRLYPYVSCNCSPQEVALYEIHSNAFERLRTGEAHENRDLLLEWHHSALVLETLWQNSLNAEEREMIVADDPMEADTVRVSPALASYRVWEQKNGAVYNLLQQHEEIKIRECLARLCHS